ncbi:MAG: hypothetical protein FWE80_05680 [Oscillospiraceae bacterium]|nr:hypothetical protein [Oscillospiraceae bacterium]
MQPIKFTRKSEILLGGFHAGSDIGTRWEKYEREEKAARLTNMVDSAGFERRLFLPEGIDIFTGVAVTDKNILPHYELLVIPPAYYALFEIDCHADIDQQFKDIDDWLADHQEQYKRMKWNHDHADYMIIWSGRYAEENICEIWVPLENITN